MVPLISNDGLSVAFRKTQTFCVGKTELNCQPPVVLSSDLVGRGEGFSQSSTDRMASWLKSIYWGNGKELLKQLITEFVPDYGKISSLIFHLTLQQGDIGSSGGNKFLKPAIVTETIP